eukprot:TRINITY_DN1468_c0_g1_i6.p1 TRINITY_DN1468_c0_g1~~TRINITY_DN1468_c0_g1_i6.p1  ORF type:complete len:837 (+),score=122.59 TRINITY_DN1468_c0_g1_i6:241-2751(+)
MMKERCMASDKHVDSLVAPGSSGVPLCCSHVTDGRFIDDKVCISEVVVQSRSARRRYRHKRNAILKSKQNTENFLLKLAASIEADGLCYDEVAPPGFYQDGVHNNLFGMGAMAPPGLLLPYYVPNVDKVSTVIDHRTVDRQWESSFEYDSSARKQTQSSCTHRIVSAGFYEKLNLEPRATCCLCHEDLVQCCSTEHLCKECGLYSRKFAAADSSDSVSSLSMGIDGLNATCCLCHQKLIQCCKAEHLCYSCASKGKACKDNSDCNSVNDSRCTSHCNSVDSSVRLLEEEKVGSHDNSASEQCSSGLVQTHYNSQCEFDESLVQKQTQYSATQLQTQCSSVQEQTFSSSVQEQTPTGDSLMSALHAVPDQGKEDESDDRISDSILVQTHSDDFQMSALQAASGQCNEDESYNRKSDDVSVPTQTGDNHMSSLQAVSDQGEADKSYDRNSDDISVQVQSGDIQTIQSGDHFSSDQGEADKSYDCRSDDLSFQTQTGYSQVSALHAVSDHADDRTSQADAELQIITAIESIRQAQHGPERDGAIEHLASVIERWLPATGQLHDQLLDDAMKVITATAADLDSDAMHADVKEDDSEQNESDADKSSDADLYDSEDEDCEKAVPAYEQLSAAASEIFISQWIRNSFDLLMLEGSWIDDFDGMIDVQPLPHYMKQRRRRELAVSRTLADEKQKASVVMEKSGSIRCYVGDESFLKLDSICISGELPLKICWTFTGGFKTYWCRDLKRSNGRTSKSDVQANGTVRGSCSVASSSAGHDGDGMVPKEMRTLKVNTRQVKMRKKNACTRSGKKNRRSRKERSVTGKSELDAKKKKKKVTGRRTKT